MSELSELCYVCQRINFAAILTPREWDKKEARLKAIYRPEYNGNGRSPAADWVGGKTKRDDPQKDYLPEIRTSYYDELSDSDEDNPTPYDSGLRKRRWRRAPTKEEDSMEGSGDRISEVSLKRLDSNLDELDDEDERARSDDDCSVSTWSGHSHYIENDLIDLDREDEGNQDYSHGLLYNLGSIWDVRSRRHDCDLCWRLWQQIKKNPDVKNKFLTKSRCILKMLELKGTRTDGSNDEVTLMCPTFFYGFKLGDPRQSEWQVKPSFVLHGMHRDIWELGNGTSKDEIIAFEDRLYGEARWRNDKCNFTLFREWLKLCETKHGHPSPKNNNDTFVRLIDVEQMCLVEFSGPTASLPRYVALSYVWGKLDWHAQLKMENYALWKTPGKLGRELNLTHVHAISAVSQLGERFLWVDALCIIQDSLEDKMNQIPQMHDIYGRAILTIVAASGIDADSGLPGVENRVGNRFRLDLDDMVVLFRATCKVHPTQSGRDVGLAENYLRQATWQARAWTFQEGYLSQRLLVFCRDQVYWECDRCTWCEETHLESDSIDFVGWRAIKNTTPDEIWIDRFERQAHDILGPEEQESHAEPSPNTYAALVKEYTSRFLSYDRDILHACTGVFNAIKEREQSEFIFGLRTKFFGNDLLFNRTFIASRRFDGCEAGADDFPSWSWISWKGSIQIANEARNNSYDLVENLVPCDGVRCFMVDNDESRNLHLKLINETGGWRFRQDYVRKGEGIYDLTDFHRDSNTDFEEKPPRESKILTAVATEIVEYSQDIALAELQIHPSWGQIKPRFHVIFRTFVSTVIVRFEFDELAIMMSQVVTSGTKMHRADGIWSNQEIMQRKVYALIKTKNEKKKEKRKWLPIGKPKVKKTGSEIGEGSQSHSHNKRSNVEEQSDCPCCGNDTTPAVVPDGCELGPYLGRLPPLTRSWNPLAYVKDVPDGVYRLLWMNNNQLPMFGHLLCKPANLKAPSDIAAWDNEILQRVAGVTGPTDIMTKSQQEKYGAEWTTVILG